MNTLLSPGELIDRSWDAYRSHFRSFIAISGWLAMIAILNVVALVLYPNAGSALISTTLNTQQTAGVILFAIANFLVSPLLGFWIFVAVARASIRAVANKPMDLMQIMKETKQLFIPALIVTFFVGLMILLAQLITIGPAFLVFGIGTWMHNAILIGFGDLLFIVAAFVSLVLTCRWILLYVMAPYACVIDGAEKKAALAQSRSLVQGRFWQVLIRVVLPKFVFILFGLGFASIMTFVIQIFINGAVNTNPNQILHLTTIATDILSVLITIFLNPLLILSDVILYQDLKK